MVSPMWLNEFFRFVLADNLVKIIFLNFPDEPSLGRINACWQGFNQPCQEFSEVDWGSQGIERY